MCGCVNVCASVCERVYSVPVFVIISLCVCVLVSIWVSVCECVFMIIFVCVCWE